MAVSNSARISSGRPDDFCFKVSGGAGAISSPELHKSTKPSTAHFFGPPPEWRPFALTSLGKLLLSFKLMIPAETPQ